jgi:ABC-type phosphate transport system substrate-binding protein
MRINGFAPGDIDYPLARPLYFLVNRRGAVSPLTKRFIDHTLSPRGQDLVSKIDFRPARAPERSANHAAEADK